MSHHLDLVRSGVASIETELQQRASLLAVDNSNLRATVEAYQQEIASLRKRANEAQEMSKRMAKMQQTQLALEKENKGFIDRPHWMLGPRYLTQSQGA